MDGISEELLENLMKMLDANDPTLRTRFQAVAVAFGKLELGVDNITGKFAQGEKYVESIRDSSKKIADDLNKKADDLKKQDFDPLDVFRKQAKDSAKEFGQNINNFGKKSRKLSDFKFDIPSMLGGPPSVGPISAPLKWLQFKRIQGDLLNRLEEYVGSIKVDEATKLGRFDVGKVFFNEPPSMGIYHSFRFKLIRGTLLSKLGAFVDKGLDFKSMVTDKKTFDIGRVFFGEVPELARGAPKKFEKIRGTLLKKLGKYVKDLDLETIISDDKSLDIGELFFGESPKMGFWAKRRFRKIRGMLFDKLSQAVDGFPLEVSQSEALDIGKLFFGESPKMGIWARYRFRNIRGMLFDKLEAIVGNIDEEQNIDAAELIGGGKGGESEHADEKHSKESVTIKEDYEPVKIMDFGDEAVVKLNKWFKSIEPAQPEQNKEKTGGFLENWGMMLQKILLPVVGVGMLAGGLLGAFSGLTDDGPLKGLKKIGSKILTMFGGKILLKVMGKGKLKAIPGIGAIFGIGFGVSRMIQGDYAGGLLEFGGALAHLIPIPGVGTAIALGIDAYLAIRDIKGGGPKELAKTSKFNQWWTQTFVPGLENLPFVRGIVEIAGGLGMMFGGDLFGGFKKLGRGLFSFTGVGTAFDMLSILFEKTGLTAKAMPVITGFAEKIKKIGNSLISIMFDKLGLGRFFVMREDGNFTPKTAGEIFDELTGGRLRTEKSKNIKSQADLEIDVLEGRDVELTEEEKHAIFLKHRSLQNTEKGRHKLSDAVDVTLQGIYDRAKRGGKTADDFVWRPGKEPQLFSPDDTIIGVKDGISLKEGKDIFFGIKDLSKDVIDMKNMMHTDLQNLVKKIGDMAQRQSQPASSPLPGIPGDYGRPIHEYRTRTRGYV